MSRSKQTTIAYVPTALSDGPEAEFHENPHPYLNAFVEKYRTPYDPKDRYDVPAFSRDILIDKAWPPKVIYDLHKYWSKKHWKAICEYIDHYLPAKYYSKGAGLIFDPFCGSGSTAVASVMEQKPCVVIDASPGAALIAHTHVHPLDESYLAHACEEFLFTEYSNALVKKLTAIAGREIKCLDDELSWLYETQCDRCGGKAKTEVVVYSQTFQCPKCGDVIPLFDCPTVDVEYQRSSGQRDGRFSIDKKKRTVCPRCFARHHQVGRPEFVISTRADRYGEIPVQVVYSCLGGCRPKRDTRHHQDPDRKKRKVFDAVDCLKIKTLESEPIPHPYPDRYMMDVADPSKPWGMEWRPGRDFRKVKELYTHRNFWALSAIVDRLPEGRLGVLLVNMAGMNVSRMRQYRIGGCVNFIWPTLML